MRRERERERGEELLRRERTRRVSEERENEKSL